MLKDLWVPEFVAKFSNLREAKIHSWSDYVSCAYSVWLFLICAAMTGYHLNFKKPIHCLTPAQFPGPWVNYIYDLCYVKSTYLVPNMDYLYRWNEEDLQAEMIQSVAYYQWLPYVLFAQLFLFFIPKVFWTFTLSKICALDLDEIISRAQEYSKELADKRQEKLATYTDWLHKHIILTYQKRLLKFLPTTIIFYILTKWMYVVVAAFQYYVLVRFVGGGDYLWALKAVYHSLKAGKWIRLESFPYVTFCQIQRASDFSNYIDDHIQCLLTNNMLNDKVTAFLTIWLMLVLVISLFAAIKDTLFYSWKMIIPSLGAIMPDAHLSSDQRMKRFARDHLHIEGIFVLNKLKDHVNALYAYEVATNLWKRMVDSEVQGLAYKTE